MKTLKTQIVFCFLAVLLLAGCARIKEMILLPACEEYQHFNVTLRCPNPNNAEIINWLEAISAGRAAAPEPIAAWGLWGEERHVRVGYKNRVYNGCEMNKFPEKCFYITNPEACNSFYVCPEKDCHEP